MCGYVMQLTCVLLELEEYGCTCVSVELFFLYSRHNAKNREIRVWVANSRNSKIIKNIYLQNKLYLTDDVE